MSEQRNTATILLVEDDQSLLDGIADLLEVVDIGYDIDVLTASNGLAGLQQLAEHTPDLIISDIMMPKMGGYEFLENLRAEPLWVHIPVIFLSAKGRKEDILAGRLRGAELYITKPFDNDELLELVRSQLDRAFQLQKDRQRQIKGLKRSIIQLLNHEFRTPLTYVTAYYEMLAESLRNEDADNLQDYLRGIQAGAVRLSHLIDDLITILEIRSGELDDYFKEYAISIEKFGELMRGVFQARESEFRSQGVDLSFELEENLPGVFGAPDLLADILQRLLDNALKFTVSKRAEDSRVGISVGKRDETVSVSVKDNGIGFPEHVHGQLFDLFFQYDRERMEQQGSGSGLAIVKGLVELHGGWIEVESTDGVGSTFTVILPAQRVSGQLQKSLRIKKPATLLVVEDEWYLLEGLQELLEIYDSDYKIQVLTARNGKEGMEVLNRHRPDLIISDIMMPYMDGYEFLTEVRKQPPLVHIPFIFLTAKGEKRDVLQGRKHGVEEYITKPYDSDDLLDLVEIQLDRYFQKQGAMRRSFDELKREILGLLQADFRMPLSSVSRYSEQLAIGLQEARTSGDLKSSLRGLKIGSDRITRLVEDFITLVEMRTGEVAHTFSVRAQPLDMNGILMAVRENLGRTIVQATVKMRMDLSRKLPPVMGDYENLSKYIGRLVEIPLQDFHAQAELGFISKDQDDKVLLEIRILGVAFSAEAASRITSLFSGEEFDTSALANLDPALVIVKGLIDLHKGAIYLDNQVDQGCRFRIVFPAHPV